MGRDNCKILQNGVFQSSKQHRVPKNVLIIEEKLGMCKLMAIQIERYGSRQSTIERFSKKMSDMKKKALEDLKISVKPKLHR